MKDIIKIILEAHHGLSDQITFETRLSRSNILDLAVWSFHKTKIQSKSDDFDLFFKTLQKED